MNLLSLLPLAPFGALWKAIPFSYMALFPVLNPLGGAFIFMTLTMGAPDAVLNTLCKRIALNTFILLGVLLLVGTYILSFFGITVAIVQVAGGIVVAYIGWSLLNQAPDTTSGGADVAHESPSAVKKSLLSKAFYPLTMPITAGPGCMAVTLTIGAHENSNGFNATVLGQVGALIGLLLCSFTVYICYRNAQRITTKLGDSGTHVIMRLSAFINFCIGLQIAWHGASSLIASLNL